jgi:cytoskeletal protein RodZ
LTPRRVAIVAAIVVVLAAVAGGILLATHKGSKHHSSSTSTTTTSSTTTSTTSTSSTSTSTTSTSTSTTSTSTTTSTTSTTSTTTTTIPASGPTFTQLVGEVQKSLRTGHLSGANAVPDAVLTCPHAVAVAAGNAFACKVASKDVGDAILVVEITSSTGSYTPFIGDTIGCSSLTVAGQDALKDIGEACNP